MNPLEKLEEMLGGLFKKIPSGEAAEREPLEIRRAILRDIAAQVQPKGRGEYFFPYAEALVELLARDPAERQTFEAAFDAGDLTSQVQAELADRGCVAEVAVRIEVKEEASDVSYRIRYQRKSTAVIVAAARPLARLLVLSGNAEPQELAVDRDLIYIGRLKEVSGSAGGLERRNDIAFEAAETTVSRKHAWLKYESAEGKFRAFNDPASSLGTRVFRDGRVIVCDSTRGVQLRSGDEIHLGDARVRFELPENA